MCEEIREFKGYLRILRMFKDLWVYEECPKMCEYLRMCTLWIIMIIDEDRWTSVAASSSSLPLNGTQMASFMSKKNWRLDELSYEQGSLLEISNNKNVELYQLKTLSEKL